MKTRLIIMECEKSNIRVFYLISSDRNGANWK